MATIDLRIQNVCDHRIQAEPVTINSDQRTLVPRYQMVSDGTVEVLRFGVPLPKSSYVIDRVSTSVGGSQLFETQRIVRLNKRDRYPRPVYSLNYVTDPLTCPKCLGFNYTDDIKVGNKGDLLTVKDLAQLAQNMEKNVVTDIDSNLFHPWVGNNLRSLIGQKAVDLDFIESEIKSEIRSSISKFRDTQVQHADSNPRVGVPEQLSQVDSIEVERDDEDPTVFRVSVRYTSMSGVAVEFNTLVDLQNYRVR